MAKTMNVKVLNVVKSTAQWASETTIISKGLLCVEMTTDGKTMIKIGDGVKTYSQLPYIVDGSFSISDYYTSEQTDSAISDAISALGNIIHIKGVKASAGELPTEGNTIGDMWFVNVGDPKTSDDYAEYVWTEGNKWEFIGRVASEVDLSDYAKTTYVDGLVETINNRISALETSSHTHTNKEILDQITAPFTTEDKTKLDGLENYDDTALAARVTAIEADYIKSTDDLTLNCML